MYDVRGMGNIFVTFYKLELNSNGFSSAYAATMIQYKIMGAMGSFWQHDVIAMATATFNFYSKYS